MLNMRQARLALMRKSAVPTAVSNNMNAFIAMGSATTSSKFNQKQQQQKRHFNKDQCYLLDETAPAKPQGKPDYQCT